ncbi:MerR family DNA-binding transcriptional regulator, partial [Listeria monocytogenes]|nr:MerR family DNA-binding transcriptional regulator [Listeria monocytogenes]
MSFSIGEFSELVGIPSSPLRFYEKEGLITPDRNKNNLRTSSEEDANWLKFLLP